MTGWGMAALVLVIAAAFAVFFVKYGGLGRFIGKERPSAKLVPPLVERPLIKPPGVPELTGKPVIPSGREAPRVAIVIDDMGQDLRKLDELLKIGAPITVAVLPRLVHSRDVALGAHSSGLEVILHLPMEPKNSGPEEHDPGKGALLTGMRITDVKARIEEDLKDVPYATGVNNHMGSLFTEDTELMRAVLEVIKSKDLYFLDSRTTSASVANRLASEMGVRNGMRNVFLDNNRDEDYIRGQIKELAAIAKKRGKAIAIGHPYPETLEVLKENVSMLKSQGIEVVRLSDLIN